ncbi:hypothetical protein SALBM135S_06092 [Streptomyces alboniger]
MWSRGVVVTARAERWPSPVEELTVRRHPDGGRVTIAWHPPAVGESHLLPWPSGPVSPGTDVSALVGTVDRLPVSSVGAESLVELTPEPERRLRVTVVSVLGDRAGVRPERGGGTPGGHRGSAGPAAGRRPC